MAVGVDDLVIVKDLAIIMIASALAAVMLHRAKQPVVLGYIIAGFLIGPFTPLPDLLTRIGAGPVGPLPFVVTDTAFVEIFRDLGLILLLFAIGIEFNVGRLKRIGATPVVSALLEMTLMFGLGFFVANLLGWRFVDAIFLGAMVAISSTAIIFKLLMEKRQLRTSHAGMITGILLIEDVVAILLLTLLPSIALTGNFSLESLALVLLKTGIFVVAALVLGLLFIPRIVRYVSGLGVDELTVIALLGLAFGFAIFADSLGFSLALGAFIAGAIVGDASNAHELAERVAPVRDMFTAVFFVAVGMLIEPALIVAYWVPILVITAVVIFGKFIAVFFASFVAGTAPETSIKAALGLAMIGEFSIILATVGDALPAGIATSEFLFPVVVSVAALTSFVTPNLLRREDDVVARLGKMAPQTVKTYARVYHGWVGRLSTPAGTSARSVTRTYLVHVIVYALLLVAVLASANLLDDEIARTIGAPPALAFLLVWVAAAFLSLPIVFALVKDLRNLITGLVERAIPTRIRSSRPAASAAKALARTFWLASSVLLVAFFFGAGAPFLPPLNLLIAAVAIVTVASFFLIGAMRDLESDVQTAVKRVFAPEDAPPGTGQVIDAIRARAISGVNWGEIVIEADAAAAHRHLRDLNLRQATGASAIAVHRRGTRIVNPDPGERVLPGDIIVVIGEPGEIEAARTLLSTHLDVPHPREVTDIAIEEVVVEEECAVAGLTLADANLRGVTGASIVAIRRGKTVLTNPGAGEVLTVGDEILLLGDASQVEAARNRFRAPDIASG